MRVYLDDVRKTPGYYIDYMGRPMTFTDRAFTARQAIALLETGNVEFISLDHDLGDACHFCGVVSHGGVYSGASCIKSVCTCDCHTTGYEVACWIEENVRNGVIKMPRWQYHSANPSGKLRIESAMLSAERFADGSTQVF